MKKNLITVGMVLLLAALGLGYVVQANEEEAILIEFDQDVNEQEDEPVLDEEIDLPVEQERISQDQVTNEGLNDTTEKSAEQTSSNRRVNHDEIKNYEEYEKITKHLNLEDFTSHVVEDKRNNRIIIFKDAHGVTQYKSIYVKGKKRLKIVDFNDGLLFNELITEKSAGSQGSPKEKSVEGKYKEEAMIASKVNMKHLSIQLVEDNKNKRILLLKDSKGHTKYKSIFMKYKQSLKIIEINGGQIYYGSI